MPQALSSRAAASTRQGENNRNFIWNPYPFRFRRRPYSRNRGRRKITRRSNRAGKSGGLCPDAFRLVLPVEGIGVGRHAHDEIGAAVGEQGLEELPVEGVARTDAGEGADDRQTGEIKVAQRVER